MDLSLNIVQPSKYLKSSQLRGKPSWESNLEKWAALFWPAVTVIIASSPANTGVAYIFENLDVTRVFL